MPGVRQFHYVDGTDPQPTRRQVVFPVLRWCGGSDWMVLANRKQVTRILHQLIWSLTYAFGLPKQELTYFVAVL